MLNASGEGNYTTDNWLYFEVTSPGTVNASHDIFLPSARLTLLHYIAEVSVLLITGLIGTIGNGIVLVYNLFMRAKSKITALETFILSSALVDFIIAFIFIPMQIFTTLYGDWVFGDGMCTVHLILGILCTSISQCTNLAIALYCLVKCVISPHYNFSIKTAIYSNVVLYAFNILLTVTPILIGYITVTFERHFLLLCWIGANINFQKYALFAIVPTMHVPTCLALVIYGFIFYRIRGNQHGQDMKRNKKSCKSMVGLFLIFMLCFIPNSFLRFTQGLYPQPPFVIRLIKHILYVYTALNPIYYVSRVRTLVPPKLLKAFTSALEPSVSGGSNGTQGSLLNDRNTGGNVAPATLVQVRPTVGNAGNDGNIGHHGNVGHDGNLGHDGNDNRRVINGGGNQTRGVSHA